MRWVIAILLLIYPIFFADCVGIKPLETTFLFPNLSLYRLDGKQEKGLHQKLEVFFVGFRAAAKAELNRWYESFGNERNCVPFTVVPVFPSIMSNALIRKPLLLLLDAYVPHQVREHVGVVFESEKSIATTLRISDIELQKIHIFVVDKKGSVLWRGSGAPTLHTLASMKQIVQAAQLMG
jgi:hypothetical protein